jgi:hypothetical protein
MSISISIAKKRTPKYWRWGYSKQKGSDALVMETIPTFPILVLGHANSGKESLFTRTIGDQFSSNATQSSGILTGRLHALYLI